MPDVLSSIVDDIAPCSHSIRRCRTVARLDPAMEGNVTERTFALQGTL